MRPLKNVQICSRPRTISLDSGIGFAEGEPVRARGMDALSQRENFNRPREMGFAFHRASRNTFSVLRIALKVAPYGLKKCTSCKMLSLTQKLDERGRFAKVYKWLLSCLHTRISVGNAMGSGSASIEKKPASLASEPD